MDRRQKKTREAIFRAFQDLLEHRHFHSITVQDIIDRADIGRSTFYSHFETKDLLLQEMCTEVFEHVFSLELKKEEKHDFSLSETSLRNRITHLLFHILENRGNIAGLLCGESRELFAGYFTGYVRLLFSDDPMCMRPGVPKDFVLNHLSGSFSEDIRHWIETGMKESPEEIADYFLKMIEYPKEREDSLIPTGKPVGLSDNPE